MCAKGILGTDFVIYDNTQLRTSWSPFDLLVWVLRNTEHALWTWDHPFRDTIQEQLSYSESWTYIFVTRMVNHMRRVNITNPNL